MKKIFSIRYIIAIATLFVIIGATSVITTAADPQIVVLLPFKINAEKDLTYLQNGIFDMLSSRLTDPGKVMVLSRAEIDTALAGSPGPQDEAAARSLGETLGGKAETFMGLAGMGDLILTCTDDQSRNRRLGLGIGRGEQVEQVISAIGQEVEGFKTAREVHKRAGELGVSMPITEQVYAVLYQGQDPHQAVRQLLEREPRAES